jgi:hypothetical protein
MWNRTGPVVLLALILLQLPACNGNDPGGGPAASRSTAALSFGGETIQVTPGTVSGCQIAVCVQGGGCTLCTTGDPSADKGCQPFAGCNGTPADDQMGLGQMCTPDGCVPTGCFPAYCNATFGTCQVCDDGDPGTVDTCVADAANPCRYTGPTGSEAAPEPVEDIPVPPADLGPPDVPDDRGPCVPDCTGKGCGDDGCGGQCGGGCSALSQSDCFTVQCVNFQCVPTIGSCDDGDPTTIDWCTAKDGCRHEPAPACQPTCVMASSCFVDATGRHCDLKQCGDDGCGGSCGDCAVPADACRTDFCDTQIGVCTLADRICDDDSPATLDFCSPVSGCQHVRIPGTGPGIPGLDLGGATDVPAATPDVPVATDVAADSGTGPDAAITPDVPAEPDVPATADVPAEPDVPATADVTAGADAPAATDPGCHPDASRDAPCVPQCSGKACGPDGCGGTCGSCPADSPFGRCSPFACVDGHCLAQPVPCPSGESCDPFSGQCQGCVPPAPTPDCTAQCQDQVATCEQHCPECNTGASCATTCQDQGRTCTAACPLAACRQQCQDADATCKAHCPECHTGTACGPACDAGEADCEQQCEISDCTTRCQGQAPGCEAACTPADCPTRCQDAGTACQAACAPSDDACRAACQGLAGDLAAACTPIACGQACDDQVTSCEQHCPRCSTGSGPTCQQTCETQGTACHQKCEPAC